MGPNVPPEARSTGREPPRVSLLLLPDAGLGTLTGMFDTLSAFSLVSAFDDAVPSTPRSPSRSSQPAAVPQPTASGLTLPVHRSIDDPGHTDIAIVPSLMVQDGAWSRAAIPSSSSGSAAFTRKARSSAPPAPVRS